MLVMNQNTSAYFVLYLLALHTLQVVLFNIDIFFNQKEKIITIFFKIV